MEPAKPPLARMLIHGEDMVQRMRATADTPAFYLGVNYERAFQKAGYRSEVVGPRERGIVKSGWRFRGQVPSADLVAVCQGYACVAALLGRGFSRRPPLILHTWKLPWTGPTRVLARVNDLVLDRVLRSSNLVVVASQSQQRTLERTVPQVRSVWIPVSADTDWWKPGPPQTTVLDRLGVRPAEFFLCVGDVDRDETAAVALAKKLGRRFVRVTRDPRTAARARAAFEASGASDAQCLVNIPFPELRDLYVHAWAVLTAPVVSYHPAGLTTITEALACGAVVLFPDSPTAKGYLEHGVNGLVYSEASAEGMFAACEAALDETRHRAIRNAARRTCEEKLNYEATSRLLYDALVSAGLQAR
jgi:glycosyltransferase involved in cell wall biosynthesis